MTPPFDRTDPRYASWVLRRSSQLRRLALALKPPSFSPERIAELYRRNEPQGMRLSPEEPQMFIDGSRAQRRDAVGRTPRFSRCIVSTPPAHTRPQKSR
jgi:hypothetical protein